MLQLSRLPGEVGRDGRGDEGLHGLPVDLLEHEQDLGAFGDQFALTAGVELLSTHRTQGGEGTPSGYQQQAAKTAGDLMCDE